ncbi:hypothetical protein V8C44DRAFT_154528 [Trichoderma aethiopicum]
MHALVPVASASRPPQLPPCNAPHQASPARRAAYRPLPWSALVTHHRRIHGLTHPHASIGLQPSNRVVPRETRKETVHADDPGVSSAVFYCLGPPPSALLRGIWMSHASALTISEHSLSPSLRLPCCQSSSAAPSSSSSTPLNCPPRPSLEPSSHTLPTSSPSSRIPKSRIPFAGPFRACKRNGDLRRVATRYIRWPICARPASYPRPGAVPTPPLLAATLTPLLSALFLRQPTTKLKVSPW